MQTLRRLVCGTDFSECAEQALAVALTLAVAANARVTLVHVCTQGDDDLDERRLLQCGEALAAVVAEHHGLVEVTGVLRSGRPWEKLDNVAVEVGAYLIVIGRQGEGRRRSDLVLPSRIGSVAAHLVRSATRPVLIVGRDGDLPSEPQTA
ncbi:MAG: universal stress protein [Myxococcales bacterium]|nr:universal stress protein [Myxococcales bacterium]